MKIFSLSFFILLSSIVFSQSWHAESGGNRYLLTKTSSGVYTLKLKSSGGSIVTSKLTVYSIKYDNAYYMQVGRTSKKDEYCTEKVISGNGKPWPKVILCWYNTPLCLFSTCSVMTLLVDDGFDYEEIVFIQD